MTKKVAPGGPPAPPLALHLRRRSSAAAVLEDLAKRLDVDHAPGGAPGRILSSLSIKSNYLRLSTTAERVDFAHRQFKAEIEEPYGANDSTLSLDAATFDEFVHCQEKEGLDDCSALRDVTLLRLLERKKDFDPLQLVWVFVEVLMLEADFLTDFLSLIYYTATDPFIAILMGVVLGFSLLVQCLVSLVMGQPLYFALFGLTGLKPVLEAWRDATDAKQFARQKLSNARMLWISRLIELVFESLPQAVIQTVAILSTPESNRTSLQYVSLTLSLVAVGFAVTSSDRSLDLNKKSRKADPLLFGYVRPKAVSQLVGMYAFFSSYAAAKMFALSVLILSSCSARRAMVWLLIELVLLLGIRIYIKNWRLYRAGADSAPLSLLFHLAIYLALLAAPFPLLRSPVILTPRLYSLGLLYMITINFCLVGVSYRYYEGPEYFSENNAWTALVASTVVCVFSAWLTYKQVPATHKSTFREHYTLAMHIDAFWFEVQTHDTDTKGREIKTQDGVRAILPLWAASCYLPKEKLIKFFGDNWSKWEAQAERAPEWFDDDFKALVPPELLVNVNKSELRVSHQSSSMETPVRTPEPYGGFSSRSLTTTPQSLYSTNSGRIESAKLMFRRDIVELYCSSVSTASFDEVTISEFFSKKLANGIGLTKDEIELVKSSLIVDLVLELRGFDKWRVINLCLKTTLGYTDLGTDIMALVLYATMNAAIAEAQAGVIAVSFFIQCIHSAALGQPLWVFLSGLIGMKPMVEAYRDAVQAKPFHRQKLPNDAMLVACRVVEMLFETIPQGVLQFIGLLWTDPNDRTTIQYVSLGISVVALSLAVSFSDRVFDLSEVRRKKDPKLFGYVPPLGNGKYEQLFAQTVFVASYSGSKMFALAALFVSARGAASVVCLIWLATEFWLLFAARFAIKNWKFYARNVEGTVPNLLFHLAIYIGILAAPFPLFRMPAFLTYRLYSLSLLYMLVSNFVLLGVSYHLFEGCDNVAESAAFSLLSISTAVCFASGAVAYYYVPQTCKRTFTQHYTLKRHLSTFWWDEAVEDQGLNNVKLTTRDGIRASIAIFYADPYLPKEKLILLFGQNWKRWEAEPPDWFTDEYKALVPKELLVDVK